MAMKKHPVTGVFVNEIGLARGPVTAAERQTARLLLDEGHARWVVAAMLGRFPLAFDGTGKTSAEKRPRPGGGMTLHAARNDPRQISMEDHVEDFFNDLFGDGDGT